MHFMTITRGVAIKKINTNSVSGQKSGQRIWRFLRISGNLNKQKMQIWTFPSNSNFFNQAQTWVWPKSANTIKFSFIENHQNGGNPYVNPGIQLDFCWILPNFYREFLLFSWQGGSTYLPFCSRGGGGGRHPCASFLFGGGWRDLDTLTTAASAGRLKMILAEVGKINCLGCHLACNKKIWN